ncbi:hypothetical protein H4F38_17420 [Pectobacterium brasiliense]|uniref:hypothetical protein n=1 Tax=Pectobacterium brasiliense TaxID=180957 RepID=UPI00057C3F5A|nr:hypothetical protein [Pectobacterium brasiliense]APS30224.1 hypothetical protein NC16_11030 [Pectobacterium brasiliense]KHT08391.1 hypothetical protein RC91_04060 [Pectobacterium brasiliense]MBN3099529.1 hypothetical protein [Pectobacterium brasiliense]MBN3103540.1 hypothetical protein [Pectobacterium brasiliense]MBN3165112.1 hypothetical protein [Pectobacterium brasiliense]
MSKYYTEKLFSYPDKAPLGDDKFSTADWWRVKKLNDHQHIFSCLSGAQRVGEQEVEITESEYNQLVNGELTANDICMKYKIG